jgi:hypothetical protein
MYPQLVCALVSVYAPTVLALFLDPRYTVPNQRLLILPKINGIRSNFNGPLENYLHQRAKVITGLHW